MNIIVNVDENWGIGRNGTLLFRISADLRRFRELTSGGTVIYGRKTLKTFPGGKVLPNRKNVILSHDTKLKIEGAKIAHTEQELFSAVQAENSDTVWVIGGASVYEALLPYCRKACITKVFAHGDADRFFPDLDALPNWQCAEKSEIFEENGLRFQYVDYVNLSPLQF